MVVFPNIEEIRAPGSAVNEWPGPAEALELMGNLVSFIPPTTRIPFLTVALILLFFG